MNIDVTLKHAIVAAAATGNVRALEEALSSGSHHGRPGAASNLKRFAAQAWLRNREASQFPESVHELAASPIPSVREVAACVIAQLWPSDESWTELVIQLATDEDWEVREWSAEPFTSLLSMRFPSGVERIRAFVHHPHPSVRRQVVIAIKRTAQKRIPASCPVLLELLEPLLDDEDEYVRKNLGPYCIGDGLLRVYPVETLAAVRDWANRDTWAARWNVAMAFTTAEAAKYVDEAYAILKALASEGDRRVLSAVRKACTLLLIRVPGDRRIEILLNESGSQHNR